MLLEPAPSALTWMDGEFVPWSAATMHLCDHHYGVGVFEGVRAYGGDQGASIFRLRDHTRGSCGRRTCSRSRFRLASTRTH